MALAKKTMLVALFIAALVVVTMSVPTALQYEIETLGVCSKVCSEKEKDAVAKDRCEKVCIKAIKDLEKSTEAAEPKP